MKLENISIETVQDSVSFELTCKNIIMENIIDISDENTLQINTIFVESIVDYPLGQSV